MQIITNNSGNQLLDSNGKSLDSTEQGNASNMDSYQIEVTTRKRGLIGIFRREPLLWFTILGVVMGVVFGLPLREAQPSSTVIRVLGLAGDIMINLLKMLVLPLVATSMILGVCSLRSSQSSAMMSVVAKFTIITYLINMLTAVVLGLLVVLIVRPGRDRPFENEADNPSGCSERHSEDIETHKSKTEGAVDSLVDTVLSFFPSNIVTAAVDLNILGIISFSLMFGTALSSLPHSESFIEGLTIFSKAITKMLEWVIWVSPIGIFSLILKNILEACSVSGTLEALGLFIVTVLLGLSLFAFGALPLFYFFITQKNPLKLAAAFSQAMVTGFGTDSSAATLPVIMECAEKFGIDKNIIDFVLPLGTTINMSGTALYEAVAVLFIAQANGEDLSFANIIVVALTATLAAMGAAAIPSAGLVTMIMVLTAVGLEQYASNIAVILAVDWFLDRCRTTVNLLGDGTCCAIINVLVKRSGQKQNL
eukprot:TRINITY_DN10874_c0_g1_i1.p1 TRINITY_DN10874_c0_g1~~TRINITY_DN10874_c0_g1_i1.p1  ORF type:complete len:514 (+),score=51.09 TRINITY_DN10874_c0_g1_i1:107-1543(+)